MARKVVVTGGGGFIGAYLVKKLVREGWNVGVIDTMVRGDASRFAEVAGDVELHSIDVRDEDAVTAAIKGSDVVMHLVKALLGGQVAPLSGANHRTHCPPRHYGTPTCPLRRPQPD